MYIFKDAITKQILDSLSENHFNQVKTAEALGISRNTLRKYVGSKEYSKQLAEHYHIESLDDEYNL